MRAPIVILLVFIISGLIYAQKVDIDNYRLYISCIDFPVNYVPQNARTFTLKLSGAPAFITRDKVELINIYGWSKVDNKAGMDVKVNIKGFFAGSPVPSQRVDEKKDKDGKVISKNIYHRIRLSNTARGEIRVYGIRDEMTSKGKVKDEKKIIQKKQEEASNPFLKNVDTRNDGADSGDLFSEKAIAYTENLDYTYVYETREYLNPDDAQKEYAANAQIQIRNHENQYRSDYPADVTRFLNRNYGYKPIKYHVKFKRLDKEDHPEYTMFDNATKACKTIFAKMRYNQPIAQIEKDLQPVIEYFDDLTRKYKGSSKHEKNLRGAAFYNLARMYQYLDQHDKVIEIGQAIIATGHNTNEGKDFIKESEEIQRKLDFHQMKSRHIIPQNKNQEKDDEGEVFITAN
jgi:hypothetical protein